VRGNPVGKGGSCPGHVDVRRPTVVGDDLGHGSGLGQQRVQVASRRRLIAGLARDYGCVEPGAQLKQPRYIAGAGRTQILDPVPAAKRDDIFQAGQPPGRAGRRTRDRPPGVDEFHALNQGLKLIGAKPHELPADLPRMLKGVPAPYKSTVLTSNDGTANPGAVSMPARQPLLMAGLGAATISCSPIFVALSRASPVSTAFYRTAIALPVLAALAMIEQRRYGPRPLTERLRAALAGAFLAVDLILWAHAIADVGAGVATVLGNLQVLFVAGLAWLLWKERPSRAVAFALPVVMVGVVLVSGVIGSRSAGQHPLAGICYGLGTSMAYAGYLLILRKSSSVSVHVAGPVADATASSAITALAFGLVFGGLELHPFWPAIGWLAALALLSQTAGWLLIASSLPRLPAAVSSLMLLLQPAASLALAAVILGQRPTLLQIAGAVLTCGGALAASLSSTRPALDESAGSTEAEDAAAPETAG
jgi:drug/metabolite transporter (DMT)-like permease